MSNEYELVKHLEMIQGTMTRTANNSFLLKGWTVTIIAAVYILVARTNNNGWLWIALLPCLSFWWLDGFFLRQERLFRKLFDAARKGEDKNGPYSMNTKPYEKLVDSQIKTASSKTLLTFHGSILALILISIKAMTS